MNTATTPAPAAAPAEVYTARTLVWPPLVGDLDMRLLALHERKRIRDRVELQAWRAGANQARLVDAHGAVLDHWTIPAGKYTAHVGQTVDFPSRSAPGGSRYGRVLQVTATRVLVGYTFRNGRATTKWVSLRVVTPVS